MFTLVYAVLGVVAGQTLGPWVGLLVALAAPLCGYVAVRLAERVKRIGGLVEGYQTVKGRRDLIASVVAHRSEVVDAARAAVSAP